MTFWRTFMRMTLGPLPLFILILTGPSLLYELIGYGAFGTSVNTGIVWFIWTLVFLLTATAIAMAYQSATKRMEHDAVVEVF